MVSVISSYWQAFRVIFVLFSLYLMGDVFYRWDGFRYYASFSEFLPGVALIIILWSIAAVFAALLIWLPGKALEWFFHRMRWKAGMEHLLLFICIFVLSAATVWLSKRLVWQHMPTTFQLKLIILSGVVFAAISLTWLLRNKMAVIQERITPLVWLFGILFMLSVPLAAYNTGGEQTDNPVSQKIPQSSVTDSNRPNIILVIFDTLAARDMSVYGYNRPTTPFISEWAKAASLFTMAQADSNFTSPTTATLMTGKRSWTHRTYHIGGSKPVRNHIENLPLVLKNNGYYNMAFVVNPYASPEQLGISENFMIAEPPIAFYTQSNSLVEIISASLYRLFGAKIRLHDWIVKEDFILYRLLSAISQDSSETIVPPEEAFNKFLAVIDNNPPAPFFAWIHLLPPHDPYLPPAPYMGTFDSSPKWRTFKSQQKAPLHEFKPEAQAGVDILRARYDEFIRYCDKQFEDFITQLTTINKLKNTVIILSSDHGESFEHGFVGHGLYPLYEQLTHIPLIIKKPDQTKGQVINAIVEQVDIAPTILSLANIPAPSWMEGRSLLPLMQGEELPSRPAFSMNFQKNRSLRHQITRGTIAVRDGDYKLIHYLEGNKSLLFNLRKDPEELKDILDKEPETGQRLITLIRNKLKKANEKINKGISTPALQ